MHRTAAAAVLAVSVTALSLAQDAKWEPPAPPDGWRTVTGKDGTYVYAVPKNAKGSSREQTYNTGGIRVRAQINVYKLTDGTTLQIEASTLTGSDLKGMTVAKFIDNVIDVEKKEGATVSDVKDATAAGRKGREFRVTKDKTLRRVLAFGAPPRMYFVEVQADDAAKLDTEAANNFLKSVALVPADVVKAKAKERAEKQEAAGKEQMEKYGAKWTNDLKEMTPPDAPAVGVVLGREFKPDAVTYQKTGNKLVFRQGPEKKPDAAVEFWLFDAKQDSLAGKSFEFGRGAKTSGGPHVTLLAQPEGARVPKRDVHLANYSLKLTFAEKDKDGGIPGTIYLCTPDAGRSFVAGKFTVQEK
ncbi:MAG: hypothetical protein U0746_22050 [Gemmataceae bacterium]